jgi:hypothetical protein
MAKTEKYYKLETNSRYFTKFYKNQPLKKKTVLQKDRDQRKLLLIK